jgi:hypothetical protein
MGNSVAARIPAAFEKWNRVMKGLIQPLGSIIAVDEYRASIKLQ